MPALLASRSRLLRRDLHALISSTGVVLSDRNMMIPNWHQQRGTPSQKAAKQGPLAGHLDRPWARSFTSSTGDELTQQGCAPVVSRARTGVSVTAVPCTGRAFSRLRLCCDSAGSRGSVGWRFPAGSLRLLAPCRARGSIKGKECASGKRARHRPGKLNWCR